jgi:sulfur carrier protein
MTIWLNGHRSQLAPGARIPDAIQAAGAPPAGRGVAVAVDGQVVPRAEWDQTRLADGQRVEVVQAVQGG